MATKVKTNIIINNRHFQVDRDEMAGADIKRLGDISSGNLLFREVHGPGDDEAIQDDAVVHLHNGDQFYDMPPGTFGWNV